MRTDSRLVQCRVDSERRVRARAEGHEGEEQGHRFPPRHPADGRRKDGGPQDVQEGQVRQPRPVDARPRRGEVRHAPYRFFFNVLLVYYTNSGRRMPPGLWRKPLTK